VPLLAQICPVSNKVPTPGDGIGDGCSTTYRGVDLAWLAPDVGLFKSTFTSACDFHDKCWTQLGADYGSCDSQFLSKMKDRCDSQFNQILNPAVNLQCKVTANMYKQAVEWYRGHYPEVVTDFQYEALTRSYGLSAIVDADSCGTTPDGTTLYASGLITQINNAYLAYSGRLPTIYEFLATANAGDIVNDRAGWTSLLYTMASQSAAVQLPSVAWTHSGGREEMAQTLTVNPVEPGVVYRWRLTLGFGDGPVKIIYLQEPRYNAVFPIKGFLKATSPSGVRNMAIVDYEVRMRGSCGAFGGPCR